MHRRPSILSYRPKTSSAVDDESSSSSTCPAHTQQHTMKRTASQTFTNTHYYDVKDSGMALDAVSEGAMQGECSASQHSHSHSLSRAFGAVTHQFTRQKTRRRLSSFSSASTAPPRRRGSIQSFIESLPSSSATRKPSSEQIRPTPLPHQDSGMQPFPIVNSATRPTFSFKRFGSIRRRPTTSGQASNLFADAPNFFAPVQQTPSPTPGAAARQAAAAANQLRREQEHDHTHRFLNGLLPSQTLRDDDIKDNESGVDMTCASEIVRADSVTEKKMCKFQVLVLSL